MPNFISEDAIERAIVQRLQRLFGYESLNCYTADPAGLDDGSGHAGAIQGRAWTVTSNYEPPTTELST